MQVAVYDTYVTDRNGKLMHFDVIVPTDTPSEKAIEFGHAYLKKKNRQVQALTSEQCRFCHTEPAAADVEAAIGEDGYYILEMQGCR